jgi:predicted metal-binding membrane protein
MRKEAMSRGSETAGTAGHAHRTGIARAGLPSSRARAGLLVLLLGATLVAWLVTVQRMRGMDAGPGTDLGSLGWYLGSWVTMTAAMMLPSEAPTLLVFGRTRGGSQIGEFVGGYLIAWAIYGLAAYAVYRGIRAMGPSFLAWDERGPLVAGAALVAAGLYQLTSLKTSCLRQCRSPLQFLLRGRPGRLGAMWMGIEHGAFCVGCCFGLMLALFALGVMSLFWMGVVAAAILIEKALPGGQAFARVLVVAFVGTGICVAASPGSVPGLTQPGQMQMRMHVGTDRPNGNGMDMDKGVEMQP